MNKTLKRIVMAFIICVLGYTQIGCQSDDIKSENLQEVKNYNIQDDNEYKNDKNINEDKSNNENLTSKVEKLSSNAQIHFINTGNSDAILIMKDDKAALIDTTTYLHTKYIQKYNVMKI